ncbi:MAG: Dabb family protein [Nitrospinae bacterium]|nr:Dabb family protein [Nitrospinota bacterium]
MKEGKQGETGRLATALAALQKSTGGLMRECEVAHDVIHAKNSYDVVLNSVFASTDDLETYRVHPEHVKVLDLIKEVCESTVKVDYGI